MPVELRIQTPEVFEPLLEPSRYKGAWGGRGSGKSHFFAELLIEALVDLGQIADLKGITVSGGVVKIGAMAPHAAVAANADVQNMRNIREAYSTIMTNSLNRVIKLLTALTILVAESDPAHKERVTQLILNLLSPHSEK